MEFVGYIIGIMLIVIVVYAIIRELFILLVSFLEGIFEFVADVALTAYHTDPMLSFFVLSIIFYLIAREYMQRKGLLAGNEEMPAKIEDFVEE